MLFKPPRGVSPGAAFFRKFFFICQSFSADSGWRGKSRAARDKLSACPAFRGVYPATGGALVAHDRFFIMPQLQGGGGNGNRSCSAPRLPAFGGVWRESPRIFRIAAPRFWRGKHRLPRLERGSALHSHPETVMDKCYDDKTHGFAPVINHLPSTIDHQVSFPGFTTARQSGKVAIL